MNMVKVEKDYALVEVNLKVYSKDTVFSAGYVFLDKAYILLDQEKDKLLVYLYPQNSPCDLKKLGFDFCNEVLNYAHYFSRVKANAEAIKLIMQRVLFSTTPSVFEDAQDREVQKMIEELENKDKTRKKR